MSFFDDPPLHDFPDRAFRLLLSQPANLREVVDRVAPHLVARLDFAHLKSLERELPLPDWRRREADLLFQIPFRDERDLTMLVCLLLEHQSAADPAMPLRTLLYTVLFWEKEWRTWQEQRGGPLRLSPVLPIVFHTGSQPWTTHRAFAELFDLPEVLHGFLPSWQPLFWDVADDSVEELLNAAGAWRNALAVVRGEKQEATDYHRLFREVLIRLAKLRESDPLRWHDLMWFVLSWGWRRRPREEGQSLLVAATAAFERNVPVRKEVEDMGQQLQKTWEEEVTEEVQLKTLRESLQDVLDERFSPLPQNLLAKIAGLEDLVQLKAMLRKSARIKSLDELDL